MTGIATILRGDARAMPIPDASVDLIVTSPPYFALRSYTDGGEHYGGQIGSEPTPQEYIAALVACTREWMRVLKPTGSIFVNLGDKYVTHVGTTSGHRGARQVELNGWGRRRQNGFEQSIRDTPSGGLREKSQMNLPARYRIACTDELGLIQRAVIIWSKSNGLPESAQDRVRQSHEDWVHLTKEPRYFSAVDEIREPSDPANLRPGDLAGVVSTKDQARRSGRNGSVGHVGKPLAFNPLGKLPGSVWTVATEPLTVPEHLGVDHFAAFPTEWPRRIILGWSPSGICVECGEGRRPIAERASHVGRRPGKHKEYPVHHAGHETRTLDVIPDYRIVGYACGCPEPTAATRPAVVLDPFGGTGTAALVAKALGRHGISVDRSADYCRLAQWRTTDPGQLAKAMRVEKPPKELAGQVSLFDELEASA